MIANDFDNSPKSAEAIAKILVQQQNVLGVVGHDASKATEAARRVYQGSNLATISPTSTSANFSSGSSFAFRTVPNDMVAAEKLAEYVTSKNRNNIAIFYEGESDTQGTSYSQPVQDIFKTWSSNSISKKRFIQTFELSELASTDSESLTNTLERLIDIEQVDTVLLLPSHSDTSVLNALEVALASREISESVLLVGNDVMYDSRFLGCKEKLSNMVAVSFWNMDVARTSLSSTASNFAHRASNSGPFRHTLEY